MSATPGQRSVVGFVVDTGPEPHRERTRRLLAAHPEARALQGHVPMTAAETRYLIGSPRLPLWRDTAQWAGY